MHQSKKMKNSIFVYTSFFNQTAGIESYSIKPKQINLVWLYVFEYLLKGVFYHKEPNIKMETFTMRKKTKPKHSNNDGRKYLTLLLMEKKKNYTKRQRVYPQSHYYTLHSLTKSSGNKRWAGMTGGTIVRLTRSKSTRTDLTKTSTEVEEHSNA